MASGPVAVRLYGGLGELARGPDDGRCEVQATGRRGVTDVVEALGVPHTEIGMLLVDGEPVELTATVRPGQRLAVYPPFGGAGPPTGGRLRPPPPRPVRFRLDVHLGRLARRLRTLGLDAAYDTDSSDAALARSASEEGRVLLTRDRELLMRGAVVHGALIRSEDAEEQALQVVRRFPVEMDPFTRCVHCNGHLQDVGKPEVLDQLPPRTRVEHDTFTRCRDCGQVYWPGSHRDRLQPFVARARGAAAATRWRARWGHTVGNQPRSRRQ